MNNDIEYIIKEETIILKNYTSYGICDKWKKYNEENILYKYLYFYGLSALVGGYEDYYIMCLIKSLSNNEIRDFNTYCEFLTKHNLYFLSYGEPYTFVKRIVKKPNFFVLKLLLKKIRTFKVKSIFFLSKRYNLIKDKKKLKQNYDSILNWKSSYGCCYYTDRKTNFIKAYDCLNTFRNEIRALKRIGYNDCFLKMNEYDYNSYVNLEYLDKEDLSKYLKKNMVDKRFVDELMDFMIKTLTLLNENRIVHRDIRPENILVLKDKENVKFKLIDFGFCVIDNIDLTSKNDFKARYVKESLGDIYRASYFYWDDASSCVKLIEKNFSREIIDVEKMEMLKEMTGKNVCRNE